MQSGEVDIEKIVKTPQNLRNLKQNEYLAAFLLYKVDFFKVDAFMDREFLESVAEKMHCQTF